MLPKLVFKIRGFHSAQCLSISTSFLHAASIIAVKEKSWGQERVTSQQSKSHCLQLKWEAYQFFMPSRKMLTWDCLSAVATIWQNCYEVLTMFSWQNFQFQMHGMKSDTWISNYQR